MPGTLKLLKTLCRQAPVLAFMALATSGLATDAKAGTFIPQNEITVEFDSQHKNSRQGDEITIRLEAPELKGDETLRNSITFSLLGTGGGIQCDGNTKFIDREVVGGTNEGEAHNRYIEFGHSGNKKTHHNWENKTGKEFKFDVTLCGPIVGSHFWISWSSTADPPPFDGTSHCKSTSSCRTKVNVVSDDTPPTITIDGGSAVTEGADASFTLTASPAPSANLTVNLNVADSADFVANSDEGTDTVTIGTSGRAIYTIPTVGNDTDEGDGSVKVTVNTGTGYTVGSPDWAKVAVNDDDTRGLVLNPTSLTVNEGSSADYTVKLATEPAADVTVTVGGAGSGITVDTDTSTDGDQNTLTFTTSNWDQTQTVRVSAGQDANTADESVTLTHTTSGGDYGTNSVSKNLVVTADDTTAPATPTLSLSGPDSANEGNSGTRDLTYTVKLTSAITSGFVGWKVCLGGTATRDTDGGAIDGNADYQPRSGNSAYVGTGCFTQAFNSGSALSNTDLKIRVKGDTVVEQNETVTATLTITDNSAGVALGTATHTHTIRDDDGAPSPTPPPRA